MSAIKPLLNQIFEPLLILTSIPIPLFSPSHSASSPNAFDEIEFPRRGFPLAVQDWRDMLVYLYTARVHAVHDEKHAKMRLGMKKHAEGLRIGEMRRYMLGGHQIVVANVLEEGAKNSIVRGGVRLLRFERGAAVTDVGRDEEEVYNAATQDKSETTQTSGGDGAGDTLSNRPRTVESPHPSISIYSSNSHSIADKNDLGNTGDSPVDTVQSTVERDLCGWTLVESIRPQALYLHHLSLLVAEVHEYSASMSTSRLHLDTTSTAGADCGCSSFAEIVMGVSRDDGTVNDVVADEAIADGIPTGNIVLSDEASIAARARAKESQMEAVDEIRLRYLKTKMGVEQKIYGEGLEVPLPEVLGSIDVQPPPSKIASLQSDVPKGPVIEHHDYAQPLM